MLRTSVRWPGTRSAICDRGHGPGSGPDLFFTLGPVCRVAVMPTSSWTSSLQVPVRATSKLTSRASHDNIKQEKTQLAKSLAIVNIHIYIYNYI